MGLGGFGSGTNGTRFRPFGVHILRTRIVSIGLIEAAGLVVIPLRV